MRMSPESALIVVGCRARGRDSLYIARACGELQSTVTSAEVPPAEQPSVTRSFSPCNMAGQAGSKAIIQLRTMGCADLSPSTRPSLAEIPASASIHRRQFQGGESLQPRAGTSGCAVGIDRPSPSRQGALSDSGFAAGARKRLPPGGTLSYCARYACVWRGIRRDLGLNADRHKRF